MASLVTSMGRMAAHTGQRITLKQMQNLKHEFAPNVDKLTLGGPSPLPAGPDGKYPIRCRLGQRSRIRLMPIRKGLTLWKQIVLLNLSAYPDRVRPLFG